MWVSRGARDSPARRPGVEVATPTTGRGVGAGTDGPQLHNDDYDFPDELIERGSTVFLRIVDNYLQQA